MQGGKGADWMGIPGGKFSLGRLREGSGYCVGAVVETWMGLGDVTQTTIAGRGRKGGGARGSGELAGNGMRDVWVVGEGFFRGVGGVFDVSPAPFPDSIRTITAVFASADPVRSLQFKDQRVGFRTY